MKFKNIKPRRPKKQRAPRKSKQNEARKLQFPSIYRIIPEKSEVLHVLKTMAVIFAFAVIFVFILFTAADLYKNYNKNQQIQSQRQKLIHEINVWKSFSDKYKNYKEVYFQIAAREFQLGNFKTAGEYLQKTLFIDPNYEEALRLQKELENK